MSTVQYQQCLERSAGQASPCHGNAAAPISPSISFLNGFPSTDIPTGPRAALRFAQAAQAACLCEPSIRGDDRSAQRRVSEETMWGVGRSAADGLLF